MIEYTAETLEDLNGIAVHLLNDLKENDIKTVVIEGVMGAGKTTFTQVLLRSMGIEEPQGSPTYSIVNSYDSPFFGEVFHLDLYRLKDQEEAYDIGIEEILYDGSISFIEWPDLIIDLLPDETLYLKISKDENETRFISWRIKQEM